MDHTRDKPLVLTDMSIEADVESTTEEAVRPHTQGLLFHGDTINEHMDTGPRLKVIMPDDPEPAHLALVAVEESDDPRAGAMTLSNDLNEPVACDTDWYESADELSQTDVPAQPEPVVAEPAPVLATRPSPASFIDWAAQQSATLSEPQADAVIEPATPTEPPAQLRPSAPSRIGAGRLFAPGGRFAAAIARVKAVVDVEASQPFRWLLMWRTAGLTTMGGMALYVMVRTVLT